MSAPASCLYEGTVRHRRGAPPAGEFRHRLFMVYLDLDELPGSLDCSPLCSGRRPALAWFRRRDHLGDPTVELGQAVRELVLARTGVRAAGPVRLLTSLRCFGHCFNPVSFYYCFDEPAEHVLATVAHVTNTPWGESHSYVMPVAHEHDRGSVALLRGRLPKELHVSPLMGMEHTYDWSMTVPCERVGVHIESHTPEGERVFDATLSLQRRELNAREVRRALLRHPFPSVTTLARIYGHALSLRLRGARYFPHPHTGTAPT